LPKNKFGGQANLELIILLREEIFSGGFLGFHSFLFFFKKQGQTHFLL